MFILTFKNFQLSPGHEAIAVYNSHCVPRVGEYVRLLDGDYIVNSITYDYSTNWNPSEIPVTVEVTFIP